uniref:U-box domain containing 5 n=1 Tax=Poecilia reticulata TaxID=8081 RepID=A0A3P9PN83_POERE
MVVNLCQPHFSTTAHCNKLCADGYDVTNIVSADPSLRKQGFKLEYFLRPPFSDTSALQKHQPSSSQSEFKQVARCELTEETQVSFSHSNFRPRAPFLSAPPPPPASSRQVKLWSRGLHSLSAVTQLRVTVPCGGAASSLGLKALAVWGQPARCCPAEEVERIQRTQEANERRVERPVFFSPPVSQTTHAPQNSLRYRTFRVMFSIPEEFLDPLTQEVMALPMLLPSGMSVDASTLEEYQKREAAWGRPPNDPFTGVPFTATCQALPNPQLKSRIDHFLLQKGMGRSQTSPSFTKTSINNNSTHSTDENTDTSQASAHMAVDNESGPSSNNRTDVSNIKPLSTDSKSEMNRRKKRDLSEISVEAATPGKQRPSESKKIRNNSGLDGKVCSDCSRSVSVYSTSSSSIYRLGCGHLLCRACVQKDSKSPNSTNKSGCIFCPTCLSRTPRNNILRVHY